MGESKGLVMGCFFCAGKSSKRSVKGSSEQDDQTAKGEFLRMIFPPIFWNIQTILFVLIIVIVYFFLLGMIFVLLFDVGSLKLAFDFLLFCLFIGSTP